MTEQELMHFGIPGMRWGVRRGTPSLTKDIARNIRVSDHNLGVMESRVSKTGAKVKNKRTHYKQGYREAKLAYEKVLNQKLKERNPKAVAYNSSKEKEVNDLASRQAAKVVFNTAARALAIKGATTIARIGLNKVGADGSAAIIPGAVAQYINAVKGGTDLNNIRKKRNNSY